MKAWAHRCNAVYQRWLYRLCGRPLSGVFPSGKPCRAEDPDFARTKGDVVHPCVRYVAEGFEGHRWWMVYTPFYGGCSPMENPRLCYSDAPEGEPPTDWKFYCIIREQPEKGYNSDPTLLVEGGRMYVYWRENYTARARSLGASRATFGCYVENGQVHDLPEALLMDEHRHKDREVCPTFLSYQGVPRAYTMDIRFCSRLMYRLSEKWARRVYSFLEWTEKLGLYSRTRSHGIAIWESPSFEGRFQYRKTTRIRGGNHLYQPWHMDLFFPPREEEGLYAVVQSSRNKPDICLARSGDGEQFRLYKRPLVTLHSIGMKSLYKPSAVIVDGMFYLFYTARGNDDDKLNRLFVATMPWDEFKKQVIA